MGWSTQCPVCRRLVPIGDGAEGPFVDHPVKPAHWPGSTGAPCAASGLNITEARALVAS